LKKQQKKVLLHNLMRIQTAIPNKSFSENTRAAYKNGLACFEMFRTEFSLAKLWPPSLSHVTQFIAYYGLLSLAYHVTWYE
jgi:hypothetical protein